MHLAAPELNACRRQKELYEYENRMTWHRITALGNGEARFNLKSYWVRRKCRFNSIRGQFIMCILRVRHNVTAGPGAFALFPDNGSSRKGTLIYFRAGSGDFYVCRGLSQIALNPFQSLLLPRRGVHWYLCLSSCSGFVGAAEEEDRGLSRGWWFFWWSWSAQAQ